MTIIAERYRVTGELGRGGMGVVLSAVDVHDGRAYALKRLNGMCSAEVARRLEREARVGSHLSHPNIVAVHGVVTHEGAPVLVMDQLDGTSLAQHLGAAQQLTLSATLQILLPVISAVGTAHWYGVVHRDLKPANIFLTIAPNGWVPVVLDFGIAKLMALDGPFAESGTLTRSGVALGTAAYVAPEQLLAERDGVDQRADVWSLGVILYECLAGCRPLETDRLGSMLKTIYQTGITPVQVLVPDLPGAVSEMVMRMLRTEPASRPTDLREVYLALQPFLHAPAHSPLEFGPASTRTLPLD